MGEKERRTAPQDQDAVSDDARVLAQFSRALHDQETTASTLEAAFDQVGAVLPGVEHVSITARRRRHGYETLGSTSPIARQADQLQYDLDEGPCVDSASPDGDGWHRSGDLGADERWPRWGPRAAALGLHSILSVALLDNDTSYGAINIYSTEGDRFDDRHEVDRALVWALHLATAVSATETQAQLETAIASRHHIGMAQGILIERLGLTPDAAFSYLARAASTRQEKLNVIAASIVATGKLPTV